MVIDLLFIAFYLLWLVITGTFKLLEFVVLVLIGSIVLLVEWLFPDLSPPERLARASDQAQADIDSAHRAARLAMNDAAGQSWRNPFE